MFKLILLGVFAYLIYLVFFKKTSFLTPKKSTKEQTPTIDEMVACSTCHTYTSYDEAILSNGSYYCSQTCVDAAS